MKGSHKIELLLLMGIIIVLLFQVAYSRKPIDLSQAVLLFVAIVAVTHILLFSKVLESFDASASAPSPSVFNKMSFFLASDDKDSFQTSSTQWFNISPSGVPENHICTFSSIPPAITDGVIATSGVPLRDIVVTGPPSVNLKIDGNGDYTYFWYALTHTIAPNDTTTLFYTKGDSINNSINIKVYYDTTEDADSNGSIKLVVQHSDDTPETTGTFYLNKSVNDPHFLNDMAPHLYMLVRDSTANTLSLYVDNLEKPLFSKTLKAKCALTNQNMMINPDAMNSQNHGWDANLYYFGIYNSALTSTDRGNLYQFILAKLVLSQPSYKSLQNTYTGASNALTKAKACPFADNLCTDTNKCGGITDWTQQGLLAQRANADCLKSVVAYCNSGSNAMKPECQYWSWNSNSAQIDYAKSQVAPAGAAATGAGGAAGAAGAGATVVTGATPSAKRIADAVNQAISGANSQNANTANTTVTVLQNILATTPNMDPASANMIKSLINQNSVVAGTANLVQSAGTGITPTVSGSNAYTNSMLRTVGANLFNDLTGGLTTISTATTVPLLGNSNAGSNVAHFVGTSSAGNAYATGSDNDRYNKIMGQYRSNIVQNQQSHGLISTLTSFFM